jgi:hypothetical protein
MTLNRVFLFTFLSVGAAGCGGGEPAGNSTTGSTGSTSSAGGSGAVGSSGMSTGAAGTGGSVSGGGGEGATGGAPTGECTITASGEVSEAIATVGIVTFTTDLAGANEARIEFGLDTSYGMTAPVDLNEADYRTLLLGMKQSRDYHYRIVVGNGTTECASQDHTITTGQLPNVLPEIDVTNLQPELLSGGFLMTGQYQAMGGDNSPAYIIDSDGDYVWAVTVGNYVTGVRMSYDGKWMWINGTNNTAAGAAVIHRVSMDGLIDEDLSDEFVLQDHSITVLPDETVIFYGHDLQDCANIRQRFANGTIEELANIRDAHGAAGDCHVNFVEYSAYDDTLIFSDDYHDNYSKISREGEPVWVLGGSTSSFEGDASMWSRQHGVDVLAEDRLIFFNNGEMGSATGSIAIEVQLDLEAMTATRVWTYEPDPPISNQQLGDVQRLDNGNTVVAFSVQGIIHEVDPEGNLVQEMVWPIGGAFGYIVKRQTLYGPPPR